MKRLYFLSVLLSLASRLPAQDAPQSLSMGELSRGITEALEASKAKMQASLGRISSLEATLTASEATLAEQSATLTELYSSLQNTTKEYSDTLQKLTQFKSKVDAYRLWVLVLSALLVLAWVYKVAAILLRLKGIKTPWVLDWLL